MTTSTSLDAHLPLPSDPNPLPPKHPTKQDLEFLQLLSNPQYLSHLAQQRYFEDASFLNYLNYLNYFRRPEFVKFVSYPDALEFLDLLVSSPAFRRAIARPDVAAMVREQQMWQWRGGGVGGGGGGEAKAERAGAGAAAGDAGKGGEASEAAAQ